LLIHVNQQLTEFGSLMPRDRMSVTDMPSVGDRHTECRHSRPNFGPLSVEGSGIPLSS